MWVEHPPGFYRHLYPGAQFCLPVTDGDKCVYLTFDDGPIPEATPEVLEILNHFGVKASFFMVGDNVRKYPELYQRVVNEGHAVGNHTMHHLQGLRTESRLFLNDVAQCDNLIHSSLFRPPHGFLRPRQFQRLKNSHRLIFFDIVTRDYNPRISPQRMLDTVRKYVRNGSIVVMHDSLKSIDILRIALPQIIAFLMKEGYKMKSL